MQHSGIDFVVIIESERTKLRVSLSDQAVSRLATKFVLDRQSVNKFLIYVGLHRTTLLT